MYLCACTCLCALTCMHVCVSLRVSLFVCIALCGWVATHPTGVWLKPFWSLCVTGEFWLGLKKIHSLASQGHSLLHIQSEDWKQGKRFIDYSFSLEGPESNYTIHLTQPSGDLPDAMTNVHTGMMFSTKDRENDNHQDPNCSHDYTGRTALTLMSLLCKW